MSEHTVHASLRRLARARAASTLNFKTKKKKGKYSIVLLHLPSTLQENGQASRPKKVVHIKWYSSGGWRGPARRRVHSTRVSTRTRALAMLSMAQTSLWPFLAASVRAVL